MKQELAPPPYKKKISAHFGKIFLLVGFGLACLIALELRQKTVEALEIQNDPVEVANDEAQATQVDSARAGSNQVATANETTPASGTSNQMMAASEPVQVASANETTQAAAAASTWIGASFPVENFQAYTSPFGYRRSPSGSYNQEFHYGLDMAAPEGSYIRNWWAGTVVEVSDDSACGTSVVVESGAWTHIYCHMSGHVETANGHRYMIDRSGGVQIREGQPIPAGVRIGRVGMTGRTTGPHLHWGLKYDSNWVDPGLVLRAMYTQQAVTPSN